MPGLPRELNRGDWLHIAPRRRHRIEETESGSGTIWLALFREASEAAAMAFAIARGWLTRAGFSS